MPITTEELIDWLTPLGLLIGGFLAGALLDRLVLARLRAIAARTEWHFDETMLSAIGRMAIIWCGLAGVYLATFNLPLEMRASVLTLIRNILFVLAALSVTVVVSRAAVGFVHLYAQRVEGILPSTSIFSNLVKLLIFSLGGMIILQSLGISITPVLTALGVGGLAVALALQDTLSNLFSGFQIIASQHVRLGDYVKLGSGEEGYVRDITWRITTIQSIQKFMVVVPNSKLASAIVINYHQPGTEMSVLVPVGVSYDSDLEQVERVTVEVARDVMEEVEGGVPEFEPVIRFNTFADSSINFNVVLRTREFADQYVVRHEFIKRLHVRYQAERINIPFPIRTVYLKGEAEANGQAATA